MSTTFGYTNTAKKGMVTELPDLAIANNYAVKSQSKDEVILTNTSCPVDQPETFRIASQRVANVYSNSAIDPQYFTPSKYGRSIVVGLDSVGKYSVTSGDVTLDKLFPLSAHLVFRVPENSNCSSQDILTALQRLEAFIHTYVVNSSSKLEETDAYIKRVLQGALVHPEV